MLRWDSGISGEIYEIIQHIPDKEKDDMNQLPYEFHDRDREIVFKRFDLPSPWINYLSNGNMHAFVSQAGGGMLWWKNPMVFRLTRYRFYNLPTDTPGFYIYIKMPDGSVWSPSFCPAESGVDFREAAHAPGYSVFTAKKDGITANLTLFMAQDTDALLWDLSLKNENGEDTELNIYAYTELSQYLFQQETTLGYYLKWNTMAEFDQDLQAITYMYTAWMHPRAAESPLVYFGSDREISSWCCSRDLFCGNYRDERNPLEIEQETLSNTKLQGGEPCAALHSKIRVEAGKEDKIHYFLGAVKGALSDHKKALQDAAEALRMLREEGAAESQFEKCHEWWKKHLSVYQCEIPNESAMREINTWNPLQSVQTGRYSRSISSSASGVRGIGFRDSAQDMLAQAYRKPDWAKEMLRYLCSLQLPDGHPVHIAFPEECKPPQDITRSDNHLWLLYLAYAIAAETGDISFLDEEVPFLSADLRGQEGSASIWEHLLRGIDFTEKHLGSHGLPLILFSDWNDHLGPFGRQGRGESMMVSEQLVYGLRQMIELAELRSETDLVRRFEARIRQQEEALRKYAWDGKWFLRGLDDDGKPIGTKDADYMRVWANAQSWMVIAGAESQERMKEAMDNAGKELDTGLGLMLNAPGMPLSNEGDSKVNGLLPGYSENGGIFCQANCWMIMAEALLGRGEKAWKYYTQIIPHEIILKTGVENYGAEAYAYCSTLLGKDNEKFGKGCVSQVTGTSAWMDVVSTQYLLGVRPTMKGLLIDPAIPADWEHFAVTRVWRGVKLHIRVENPDHKEHGIQALSIDGKTVDLSGGALIREEMIAGKKEVQVLAVMGD